MTPEDPHVAQQIVAAYAAVLERCDAQALFPAPVAELPYPRDTIKTAVRSVTTALFASGQLTPELHDFLERAYLALADFVDDELARLMRDYNRAADDLAVGVAPPSERVGTAAWQTLQRSGALAGEIAKTIAADTARLRVEFQAFDPVRDPAGPPRAADPRSSTGL